MLINNIKIYYTFVTLTSPSKVSYETLRGTRYEGTFEGTLRIITNSITITTMNNICTSYVRTQGHDWSFFLTRPEARHALTGALFT